MSDLPQCLLCPQVDAIKGTLSNDEQKVGAEIVRRSLGYPLKLIANNAGVNGSVVQQKVLDSADPNVGYNASTGEFGKMHSQRCFPHISGVAMTT